ncbi:uncharacterized protein TRAVEDRAFT_48108 [Trametes versicolor FP-101664 SS1]|uniref:uncharacterized protein n=1 Tax=Trametes versicolor (strain FP-101664) TaxID=717944 RepID=UPI0004621337|nr:uncharacterized protein TRAVEDRAFT_48108 [Trametes versicolor FP-101664 SS1]EIW58973.1 hypothetical protein TRAVEDRAFT_48108 [Trametes versicolor FP-101664 SS1]
MPSSHRMSASGSDPNVKALVRARLPTHTALNAALRICPRGAGHMYQPSYGLKDFSQTGFIYDVCLYKPVKDGPPRCPVVLSSLQMTKDKRIDLLNAVSELQIPPYNNERYATDTLLSSMRLRRGEDVWPPPGLQDPFTPTHRQRSRAEQSNTRSGASAASSAKVGRPPNATVDVNVYVYTENGLPPLELTVTGIDRGPRVEFTVGQPQLYEILGVDKASRHKKVFLLWLTDAEEWSEYPKAHTPMFLPRGQAVLYKAQEVYDMPGLLEYRERFAPVGRAVARPRHDAHDVEEPARLPSLLQHVHDAHILSSPPSQTRHRESPALPHDPPVDVPDAFLPSSSPRLVGTPSPGARRVTFFPSPVSSPDLPDGLEIVRRHWAAKYVRVKADALPDDPVSLAGPSSTALGKRRASSGAPALPAKRMRNVSRAEVSGEGSNTPATVATTEVGAVPSHEADDIIELSDDDEPCHASLVSGYGDDVVNISGGGRCRVETIEGKEYIVISDDE